MTSRRVNIVLEGISFHVKEGKEQKQILNDVNAGVNSGEMMCILGPSGGGKTSLIHIIAQRIRSSGKHTVSGNVLCNGKQLPSSQFLRLSGLVTQEDIFNVVLTVRETLLFAARLKLSSGCRKTRVDEVISLLGLEKCSHTKVGDDANPYLKGISGGEKRRLAIALEILEPKISILVLDEPTSGLDAAAALNVVKVLRDLAASGMTVISTLHQPRRSIMVHYQRLLILSQGRRVYFGSVDEYTPYLETYLVSTIPEHESPYDFLLDVLNPAVGQDIATVKLVGDVPEEEVSNKLADLFEQSELRKRADESLKREGGDGSPGGGEEAQSRRAAGWCTQFLVIFLRTALVKLRDPTALMTQLVTAVSMGVLIGIIFFNVYDREVQFAYLDSQMAVTLSIVMIAFAPFDAVLTFPMERRIYLRERKAGLYSSSSLFFGRILADMPQHAVIAVVQAVIVYFMVGLKLDFFPWVLLNIGAVFVGAAAMQFCGAISKSFEEANVLVMLILMLSMMLSDAFVRSVPSWLEWAREISLIGLLADLANYLEFKDESVDSPLIRNITDEAAEAAVWKLFAIFAIFRLFTFFAIKFMYTGQSFRENLFS